MVNYSKPRKSTIHKYELLLKSLIIKINKEGKLFQASSFCTTNKVGKHFTTVCKNLGFIIRDGNRATSIYTSVLNPEEVNTDHARNIAVEMLRYNVKHMTEYKEKEGINITSSLEKSLSKFDLSKLSDEQLFDEIRKRGYKGSLCLQNKLLFI
jgi:hypothetical protein